MWVRGTTRPDKKTRDDCIPSATTSDVMYPYVRRGDLPHLIAPPQYAEGESIVENNRTTLPPFVYHRRQLSAFHRPPRRGVPASGIDGDLPGHIPLEAQSKIVREALPCTVGPVDQMRHPAQRSCVFDGIGRPSASSSPRGGDVSPPKNPPSSTDAVLGCTVIPIAEEDDETRRSAARTALRSRSRWPWEVPSLASSRRLHGPLWRLLRRWYHHNDARRKPMIPTTIYCCVRSDE